MKRAILTLIIILGLLMSYLIMNEVILKNHIFVKETYVYSEQLPDTFDGVRVVQFSDALISSEDDLVLLENLHTTLDEIKPDIIIFTGDLFAVSDISTSIQAKATELLSSLQPSIAKIAVLGDLDLPRDYETTYKQLGTSSPNEDNAVASAAHDVLTASQFTILKNERINLYHHSDEFITITGLTPLSTHTDTLVNALVKEEDTFSMLLMHEPTLAPFFLPKEIDLQLSGHCLGTAIHDDEHQTCAQYPAGTYHFADQLTLHVNEGLQPQVSSQNFFFGPTIHSFLLLKK